MGHAPVLRRGRPEAGVALRKPDWLKVRLETGESFTHLKGLMRAKTLHTVCEEARCPNIYECWNHGTATFMILGDTCTRNCGFCAVKSGRPTGLDLEEPFRVAQAVASMRLEHVVITCVARDDLEDQGASVFAATIRAIRQLSPGTRVEVLTSDFQGRREALQVVMDAEPDIYDHNIETVRRLTPLVRSRAEYDRSLAVLRMAKEMKPHIPTKSSIMLGFDETREEILQAMDDLRAAGVDILTIGQYLQPTPRQLQVMRYVPPEEFAELKEEALRRGFRHCESGPLVRTSYHAWDQVKSAHRRGLKTPTPVAVPDGPPDDVAILEAVEAYMRKDPT
ncbi:lipoyl synthase [Caldinitratiruptor microaerophilus]|uniref:Lipoyl synthase n=1 Tax=Caldinitratiruptor microaerophilus TaxID=671077 RepID=A0AA35G8Y9_9FIRM|nr:lipoyl synthase [Caldinitratiruptor microaerophilus]